MSSTIEDSVFEPDWSTPLTVTLTAGAIIETVFTTASTVHTGTGSCIDGELVLLEISALGEGGENYCRFVEQEYVEDSEPDSTWHDWTVELKIGATFVVGHWRARTAGSPADWEWCAKEAERAFRHAALLMGRRVGKGLVVEDTPWSQDPAPRVHH